MKVLRADSVIFLKNDDENNVIIESDEEVGKEERDAVEAYTMANGNKEANQVKLHKKTTLIF